MTHKSKFGYHPISYDSSKRLRFLCGVYQKTLHQVAAWNRWNNKDPKNRILKKKIYDEQGRVIGKHIVYDNNMNPIPLPEPFVCPLFVTKDKYGYKIVKFNKQTLFEISRSARMPVADPLLVKSLPISEQQIDDLYKKYVFACFKSKLSA